MKAKKLAGIRLINYINDGVTWQTHKDLILDFWIMNKCHDYGFNPIQFNGMSRVVELPTQAQQAYTDWFGKYDFQNEDKDWIEFVDGTLNLFYHTNDPQEEADNEWYIDMMQSELEARSICETQVYHGLPNINAFWKVDTNSKTEEVGGRRNGYIYTNKLSEINPADTKGYYWGVVFQCPETVSLGFSDNGVAKRKCINWAANTEHMTLVRINADGRLKIVPIHVEGKSWKADRWIPEGNVAQQAMAPSALHKYINENFDSLFGIWDRIDAAVKNVREETNARITALNTMNDEEIKVSKVIGDIDKFIKDGNVSEQRREYNETVRKAIMKKIKTRDKETRKEVRDIVKAEKRKENAKHAKFRMFNG
ncbi:MAG: hypothetical protein MJZ25_03650 [Fibrobacter sp.]|nr:hypothetical protein [Fibrobacter sp.]